MQDDYYLCGNGEWVEYDPTPKTWTGVMTKYLSSTDTVTYIVTSVVEETTSSGTTRYAVYYIMDDMSSTTFTADDTLNFYISGYPNIQYRFVAGTNTTSANLTTAGDIEFVRSWYYFPTGINTSGTIGSDGILDVSIECHVEYKYIYYDESNVNKRRMYVYDADEYAVGDTFTGNSDVNINKFIISLQVYI